MKRLIYTLIFILFPLWIYAQTEGEIKDRTILVEKEYSPDINDAEKINVLPKTEKKSVSKTDVEYSVSPNDYNGNYVFKPMKSDYDPVEPDKAKQIYLHAGYGNNGMADAGFYYNSPRFKSNEIKFNVNFDGVDDKRKQIYDGGRELEWDSRYYRTSSFLSYGHDFLNMKLYANTGFGLDNFNYHPVPFSESIDDRQRHTKVDGRIGLKSEDFRNMLFDIFVDYSFFDKAYNFEKGNAVNNENVIRLNASLDYKLGKSSVVGFDFKTNNYNYSMSGIDGYTVIGLYPSYTFFKDNISLKVGINLDVSTDRDAVFNTSPDVKFDYRFADRYTLYANLGGGRIETDYRFFERINPYWNPNYIDESGFGGDGKINFSENYKVMASKLGIKGNPVCGFSFDVSGGFDMNNGDIFLVPSSDKGQYLQYSSMVQQKSTVLFGNLDISYFYKDRLSLNVNSCFMKWGKADDLYLSLKPKFEVGVNLDSRVVGNLFFNLSYKYIGRTDKSVAGNINDLSARLSYSFYRGLGVYINACNIISADNNYYYMYPSSGASVLLGLNFRL